jgi:quinol-cytochrome oxidoreductase complex cytochrome b subunit
MVLFIVRILTGMFLVTTPMTGIGPILTAMLLTSWGQISPGVHAIGSSAVMFVMLLHVLRALFHLSCTVLAPTYSLGILVLTLAIAACFLGYSTTYGAMAHWALRVVQGLMRCLPFVDMWFYGNYIVTYKMLSKCLVFHFLVVIITLAVMAMHILQLHTSGSSNGSSLEVVRPYTSARIDLYFHVIVKDLILATVLWVLFGSLLQALQLVLHTDNNIIINARNPAQLAHIIPEWYLLPVYLQVKLVPSATCGLAVFVLQLTHLLLAPSKKGAITNDSLNTPNTAVAIAPNTGLRNGTNVPLLVNGSIRILLTKK